MHRHAARLRTIVLLSSALALAGCADAPAASRALAPSSGAKDVVTITLFIPCVASVMMIVKERGGRTAAALSALIFPLAFLVGGLLYRVLLYVGWNG